MLVTINKNNPIIAKFGLDPNRLYYAVYCDSCGLVFDLFSDSWDEMLQGGMYSTARENLCWKCLGEGGDKHGTT